MQVLQLFDADARGVPLDRVCPLPDCRSANVRREINGEYSLTAELPKGAMYANSVAIGRAIKAEVNESGKEQCFVIKNHWRTLTGGMKIYAEHQSYLYNGILLGPGAVNENGLVRITFEAMRNYAVPSITDLATWTYSRASGRRASFPERPQPITLMTALKSYLVGNAGGELIFDGYNVEYVNQMGSDNGAAYRYGVNMLEMESEDILDNYASGIYPYWGRLGDANKPLTVLTGLVHQFSGTFPLQVIVPVDFTDKFAAQPSQAELQAACEEYEDLHKPTGIPTSIKTKRAKLAGDAAVDLGDTVTVTNAPWGINQKTRIVALDFNALKRRVENVELGTINPGFPGAVKNMR